MPKKQNNKGKKKQSSSSKRQIEYKGDMEEYARITKMLGDRKVSLILPDSTEMLGVIPGRFRKRCWMEVGDIVLISRREFEDSKVDIIHKYKSDESIILVKMNEIPSSFLENEENEENEDGILFIDDGQGEENEEENERKECDFEFDDI